MNWKRCGFMVLLVCVAWPVQARRSASSGMEAVAEALKEAAMGNHSAMSLLTDLCDTAGPRLAGSEGLERAIDWSVKQFTETGFSNVRKDPVEVEVWVRGAESATLVQPRARQLHILGLGNSVGTGGQPLEADVVVVSSFEELEALGRSAVEGRIVLYNAVFTTYRDTVPYRVEGPSRAAKLGAVGVLVRSVSPPGLATPHTGVTRYTEDVPKIPAAAIVHEEANLLHRLYQAGKPVRVSLSMEAHFKPNAMSANVVADIPGREDGPEHVILACHLDSWDVGEGAQDDGAGCVIVMEAARLIGELKTPPRRGIRVVLFTNEENGLAGGKDYPVTHQDEVAHVVAALEADTGAGMPLGYRLDVRAGEEQADEARHRFQKVLRLLEDLDASSVRMSGSGADIGPLAEAGVPGLGLHQDTSGYWPIHHTWADTLDKIDPDVLAKNVAVVAVTAYGLAEMPERLVDPTP
ncbi:MAG: M28 family peptidase [Myxococcota bacterium]|nr:M28 family peptidase [Myxococcota bacterium]